ncbi:MAG TPA: DUF362 domain-containing protein [Firmicutes bacterium]|jgi:uncharacterized protein (DUF362 family)/NAD-dependent dihydropyrimidine dehydrogenase PreA subunit|nr:DUF362 domain-containing protein [Bacillota bacterium]
MNTVAMARCSSYSRKKVEGAVQNCLQALGGLEKFVCSGQKVLVKPNLLAAEPPERGVDTHPEVVRAVLKELLALGAKPIVGDSPGVGSLSSVAQKAGIAEVCRELNVPLGVFNREITVKAPEGKILKSFPLVEEISQVDVIINLPRIKTHGLTRLTGAVKNLFGCVAGLRKGEMHFRLQQAEYFQEMLIDLALTLKPALTVVDGVMAMEGGGPRNGNLRLMGLILAGANPFAVDATIARLIGLTPLEVPLLALAARREIPGLKEGEVRICGEQLNEFILADFQVPPAKTNINLRAPKVVTNLFRRYVSGYPVFKDNCLQCGICLQGCPAQVISKGQHGMEIDDRRCIRCYCCQEFCPHDAILIKKPFFGRFL